MKTSEGIFGAESNNCILIYDAYVKDLLIWRGKPLIKSLLVREPLDT